MAKRWLKILLSVLTVLILATAVYFTFFFYYKCDDISCYRANQEKCVKTKFFNDAGDAVWFYKINGKEDEKCEIVLQIMNLKHGSADKEILEGKIMTCYLPLGSEVNPETDLSRCTGPLKEELQNMIIQKMHKYIIENIGQFDENLNRTV
jgi:hypothetical protein